MEVLWKITVFDGDNVIKKGFFSNRAGAIEAMLVIANKPKTASIRYEESDIEDGLIEIGGGVRLFLEDLGT